MAKNEKELLHKCKNIKKRAECIEEYKECFSRLYYEYAALQLFYNYYTIYEQVIESEGYLPEEINQFNELLASVSTQMDIEKIGNLRKHMIDVMQNITNHTDILQVFEHLFNRIEYRFKNEEQSTDISAMVNKINRFLFMDKDTVVTNDKIKTVVSELPVRMTKNRFFDILTASFSIYNEAGKESVDGFSYMLRTIGMLTNDLEPLPKIGSISDFINELKTTDYKNIEQEKFEALKSEMTNVTDELQNIVNIYMQLQEAINHFYVLALLNPYVTEKVKNVDTVNYIIKLQKAMQTKSGSEVLEECNDFLERTEGLQEELVERIMGFESLLYDFNADFQDKEIEDLCKCSKLVSSSLFVSLNDVQKEDTVDVSYVNQVRDELIKDFKELFDTNSKEVNRSVMAMVLGAVPVFFQTSKEIQDYVSYALTSCTDENEVKASIDIINSIME